MVKKRNLKEYLTDDTLDLSLCELQTVPVKEIAAFPKATCLDLSSNQLTSLGSNFATSLVHLVKLDLCRNQLTELPENFGLLTNLKHLDLYSNKLQSLPLSFCNLKHLLWLDLKENPLVPKMMQICGPCSDAQGCQFAARNVVKFLGELNREVEFQKSKKEAEEKKLHEKELLEQAQKKESKKKKKKKNTAKPVESARVEAKENGNLSDIGEDKNQVLNSINELEKVQPSKTVCSYMMSFLKALMLLLPLISFTVYALSIYDEAAYNRLLTITKNYGQSFSLKTPAWIWIYWQQMRTLLVALITNLVTFTQLSFKFTMDSYVTIMSDEKVQLFIETTKENLYIMYIKVADIVTYQCEQLTTYVRNYFK